MPKNLLLFSSSRVGDTDYLEHALPDIQSFVDRNRQIDGPLVFIPYAGISLGFEQYEEKVQQAFSNIDLEIRSIHGIKDKLAAIKDAAGVITGGGNTFALLNSLYQENLIQPLIKKLENGTPYIGWSAGSNIAGPTIRTTNDMPIIEPPSFDALNLIPWQLNPHYIDGNPPGHNGETRQQRIEEFLLLNPHSQVIGIPEGTALSIENQSIKYIGQTDGFVFNRNGKQAFRNSEQLVQIISKP